MRSFKFIVAVFCSWLYSLEAYAQCEREERRQNECVEALRPSCVNQTGGLGGCRSFASAVDRFTVCASACSEPWNSDGISEIFHRVPCLAEHQALEYCQDRERERFAARQRRITQVFLRQIGRRQRDAQRRLRPGGRHRDVDLSSLSLNIQIPEADLSNANLSTNPLASTAASVFNGTCGQRTSLAGSDLTGVNFSGANLSSAHPAVVCGAFHQSPARLNVRSVITG